MSETFTPDQTIHAIRSFLEFGEQTFGTAQQGYFSGGGWAARALRAHLAELENPTRKICPECARAGWHGAYCSLAPDDYREYVAELIGAARWATSEHLAESPRQAEPAERSPYDSGFCCLRDHMTAIAPWTCSCRCHTTPATTEPDPNFTKPGVTPLD